MEGKKSRRKSIAERSNLQKKGRREKRNSVYR